MFYVTFYAIFAVVLIAFWRVHKDVTGHFPRAGGHSGTPSFGLRDSIVAVPAKEVLPPLPSLDKAADSGEQPQEGASSGDTVGTIEPDGIDSALETPAFLRNKEVAAKVQAWHDAISHATVRRMREEVLATRRANRRRAAETRKGDAPVLSPEMTGMDEIPA